MCEKCRELKVTIERYRRIKARFGDGQVAAGIDRLIEEAEAEMAVLHRPMT
jgi:hypothetical protein